MPRVEPRDVGPILKWVRNALLGRKLQLNHRLPEKLATRSGPPPNLPDGPSHKLYGNYYYTRDGRHLKRPPMILIAEVQRKALAAGVKENTEAVAVSAKKVSHITPGKPYEWQKSTDEMIN